MEKRGVTLTRILGIFLINRGFEYIYSIYHGKAFNQEMLL